MTRHSCDTLIRGDAWAWSGHRTDGDTWTCSCGKKYQHVCDEADGCYWEPVTDRLDSPDIGLVKRTS